MVPDLRMADVGMSDENGSRVMWSRHNQNQEQNNET